MPRSCTVLATVPARVLATGACLALFAACADPTSITGVHGPGAVPEWAAHGPEGRPGPADGWASVAVPRSADDPSVGPPPVPGAASPQGPGDVLAPVAQPSPRSRYAVAAY